MSHFPHFSQARCAHDAGKRRELMNQAALDHSFIESRSLVLDSLEQLSGMFDILSDKVSRL